MAEALKGITVDAPDGEDSEDYTCKNTDTVFNKYVPSFGGPIIQRGSSVPCSACLYCPEPQGTFSSLLYAMCGEGEGRERSSLCYTGVD